MAERQTPKKRAKRKAGRKGVSRALTAKQAGDLRKRLIADEVKMGRPTIYSEELAAQIIERIAHGESVRAITREPGMPTRACLYRWMSGEHGSAPEDFKDRYREAVELGAEAKFEALDEDALDTEYETARSKLIVDTRKWILARQFPRKYGDRTTHELDGGDGGSGGIRVTVVTGVPGVPGCEAGK